MLGRALGLAKIHSDYLVAIEKRKAIERGRSRSANTMSGESLPASEERPKDSPTKWRLFNLGSLLRWLRLRFSKDPSKLNLK